MTSRTVLALPCLLLPLLRPAAASPSIARPHDGPCIADIRVTRSDELVIQVIQADWDVIQVRWSRPGRDGLQREYGRGNGWIAVLDGTGRGVMHTVSVQGRNRRPLRRPVCSGSHEAMIQGR